MVDIQQEHENYRRQLSSKEFKYFLEDSDNVIRNRFTSISLNENEDVFSRKFHSKLLNIFPSDFFYLHIQQYPDGNTSYVIYSKDMDALIEFRMCGGRVEKDYITEVIKEYGLIIEIGALHSFSKGKGKKLINDLKNLSNYLNVPIYLYDSNLKATTYYIDLGFIDTGDMSSDNEKIMIYMPTNTRETEKSNSVKSIWNKVVAYFTK
ncbi:hypothetical protein [Staphylococcus aureus]|uniref:hypothetical protein n=1 Tax=Staphylococcus aureus TaxID=1280 RepID=UPI00044F4C7D|nr:hypothetical protein [Staphylococcus aureus]EZT88936.1 hypothetical protein U922_02315 [Staphylococcus aureus 11S01420]EZV01130.1 hypothetical protein U921_02550 [Staphylococcus aureus 11S01415]HDA1764834.1 hypothetical protein [Staphylococcus aureus]